MEPNQFETKLMWDAPNKSQWHWASMWFFRNMWMRWMSLYLRCLG